MTHRTFWEAGLRVFGLHGVTSKGNCACGDPTCKAVLKHPLVSNWQHTPHWSEEQFEVMEETGQFATGYGVLLRALLVIDIDARSGGLASWEKLFQDVPAVAAAGLIVNTGSGGGSRHLYFTVPEGMALCVKLNEYPGIDFKSGAHYVVGPGSLHASGNRYEIAYGSPEDIDAAPEELLEKLRKPERYRAELGGQHVDVSHAELAEMLQYVPNDNRDYEEWVRIGMALHHASGGTAYDLWEEWSAQSAKHDSRIMPNKWHSFGKSANPVTLGTLVHYAEQGGWKQPVTFRPDVEFDYPEAVDVDILNTDGIDLLRPPGLTGKLAEWINQRSIRPRERLAAMAAVYSMGNIAGLRYTDDRSRASTNLFVFNIAGSGTGKEAIIQSVIEIMLQAGLAPATHGTIKSEQEITRNLTRNQAAFYTIDEIGFLLQKIKSAQKRGGAVYMEGVTGLLMSAYSKADGRLPISGDMREDIKRELMKDLSKIEKQIEDQGEKPYLVLRRDAVMHMMNTIDNGLDRPFLSLIGFTTSKNFDELVDYEAAANGFIGRSILCIEHDTAPPTRMGYKRPEMPEDLKIALQQIAQAGFFDMMAPMNARVEYYGEKTVIPTERTAHDMLDAIIHYFDRMAEEHKEKSGLEALMMRGYEQASKISLILAVPGGIRTIEHVRWAFALVKRDIDAKMRMVTANDREKDAPALALKMKIAHLTTGDDGETLGVILNRLTKSFKKEDIEACLEKMVQRGEMVTEEKQHRFNKSVVVRYKFVGRG